MTDIFILVGVVAVIVVAFIALIARIYKTVPPNKVMVVYGRGEPRFVTSGGTIVLPIIQRATTLDVTIMTIKTLKDEVYTVNGVPIQLDWVAQVQINTEENALRTAARAFLEKPRDEVRQIIEETLSANFRAVVGQMTVETLHRDRDDFVRRVQDLATDDIAAMGVKIISMGIEEITDNQGYLIAMAAPQIAAIKRDAKIAEAEAERAARIKAAAATREAEQAELDSQREILQQREALQLREVEVQRRIAIEKAGSDQEVQQKRALAVEQQQEAEVLVPARAERQAVEIRAEAERRRIEIEAEGERNKLTITADAQAQATRKRAEAEAEAIEKKGRADAIALEAMKKAEAEGLKADADSVRARLLAEAEGEKAKLLAEAEGRREIAAATAAEDSINLRQFIIEQITQADVAKAQAIAQALAGLGNNVRVVQFGNGNGGNGSGGSSSTFLNMLMEIPEVAEMFRTKVEALSGEDFKHTIDRVMTLFNVLKTVDTSDVPVNGIHIEKPHTAIINPPTDGHTG
jgi:flotillin